MSQIQKEIVFKETAREGLKRGVDLLANAVKITLGAKGRFVVYRSKEGRAISTKDGVTIAKEVVAVDPIESLGVDMVKEAAIKAAELSGDGTTTATVLAQALINEGHKLIAAGSNPIDIKRGMDKAVVEVCRFLETLKIDVTTEGEVLKQVATVSANGEEAIGQIVYDAFKRVGEKGVVTAEFSTTGNTYIDVVEGVKIERGYASPYMVTNPAKKEAILEDPLILLYDDKISTFKELVPILTQVGEADRSIFIVANDFDPEALATISANKLQGRLKVSAVKTPNFGELNREILDDLAAATGGKVISKKSGQSLTTATIGDLGGCEKIISTATETVIIGGKGNTEEYISELECVKDDPYTKERIARLLGGVAVIYVGAMTEIEAREIKDRVDDAIGAVRSAVEEGIIAGGGTALVGCSVILNEVTLTDLTSDEVAGFKMVQRALLAPVKTIVDNSGKSGEAVAHDLLKLGSSHIGYNVVTESIGNMLADGIIDPKKVTRVALESAASVAGIILTTDCAMGAY